MIRHAFITITDCGFFPGTLATVSSVVEFQPDVEIFVVNSEKRPLTAPQVACLGSNPRVRLLDSSRFAREGRYIGPWELKAYAAHDLAPDYDVIVGIDSDCLLCSNVDAEVRHCLETGGFLGGRDGDGADYGDSYRVYGMRTPARNPRYMSTSLFFCAVTAANHCLLNKWALACSAAVFNGRGPYPGHGDQGVLNALLYAENRTEDVHLLDNRLWSQHWTYWNSEIDYRNGTFVNQSAQNQPQRAFHCGGSEKYWERSHSDRVQAGHGLQTYPYIWFLAMLWFGPCRNWSIDPRQYLPPSSHHLLEDLADFLPQVLQVYPRARALWDSERPRLAGLMPSLPQPSPMRKIILTNSQSPGDIVMLTAAVRDLHGSYPGQFQTDVRTPCAPLWENNPYLTPLQEGDPTVEVIECHYPLIHRSNQAPYHFLHGFLDFLNERFKLQIKPIVFKGDIHLSAAEKSWISQAHELTGEDTPFWIVTAGGKYDYTIKWWDAKRYQRVVDHFRGKILFVQVGERKHRHPPLEGVIDLRGKTDLRQLVRLVYYSQGVLCGVNLLMHLAAAVEVKPGMPKNRPCVVVAGGREPPHWEAYPHHQFIHTIGALRCCDHGGCWKSRTVPLGDGDEKDKPENLCVDVVNGLPRCMDMITAEEVIRRIEMYFAGGALAWLTPEQNSRAKAALKAEHRAIEPFAHRGIE